jgi:hypothetical protein
MLVTRQSPFQYPVKLFQRDPERRAEFPQLDHVDPTLAAFAFAHEALGFTDALGKFDLR